MKEIEEKEKINTYSQQVQFFKKRKTISLSTFLKLEIEEKKDDPKQDLIFIKKHANTIVDNDIVLFGYMNKKSNSW